MKRREFLKSLLIGAGAATVPFAITPTQSQSAELRRLWHGYGASGDYVATPDSFNQAPSGDFTAYFDSRTGFVRYEQSH